MGIGYQPKHIQAFEPKKFEPKPYTWLVNAVGVTGYMGVAIFALFGLVILFTGLRESFIHWAVAALLSAFVLYHMARYLIQNYGVNYFYISDNAFTFKTLLGRTRVIPKESIIHIRVDRPNPALSLIPLVAPSLVIVTFDRMFRFRTSRWVNQQELLETFDQLSLVVTDEFAEYYHRSKSTIYSFLIRMSQDTAGVIGLTIITVYIFLALWGAMALLVSPLNNLHPYTLFLRNPEYLDGDLPGYDYLTSRFHPPSNDFWFGTDFIGRDIFARLIYGTSFTFLIALSGSLLSTSIVVFLGITSAFYTGTYDTVVSRIADALLTFPPFIPLILIATIATPVRLGIPGGYFLAVFLGMSLFTWPLGTRIVRSETIKLLNTEYILATKQVGASTWYILRYHILPKILPTILILFTYSFTDIILGTTLLGFIGMDSESTLTWGSDLAKAIQYSDNLEVHWWTVVFPTFWIFLLVFGLTIFSDSIRDNLDPTLRGGIKAVPYEQRKELEGLL